MWHRRGTAVAVALVLFTSAGLAQEIAVWSCEWGSPGWNPLLPGPKSWGTTFMYPSLFVYSNLQDRWIPYLAEGYRWVDKLTLEVTLRQEARWWDGKPITADDVVFTWELAKRHLTPWTWVWEYLAEVKAIDARTVQFVAKAEALNYFALLAAIGAGDGFSIVPKHRWEVLERQYGTRLAIDFRDDVPQEIIGGGPYKLAWWEPDFWVYERVDDWWGKDLFGLPGPPKIAHRLFKDNPAANLAFEQLQLEAMGHFTPAVWELWKVKGLPIRTYYPESPYYIGGNVVLLYINYARPPLNNLAVRRAIAHAVPFTDLIDIAYFGYSIQAHPSRIIHTTPAAAYIDEALAEKYRYYFDLGKAARILDEAGIVDRDGDGVREMPDGTRLGPFYIEVPYGWTDWMMMCEMIAENLRKIGIDVTPRFPDFAIWESNVHTGKFDLIIRWSAGPGFNHPWNVFYVLMDPRLTGPVGEAFPAGNWHRYMNWGVVPILDAIPAEADPVKVAHYYRTLQMIAYEDVVGVPLFYGAVWYIFAEHRWTGWPKAEHPERWTTLQFAGEWHQNALPTIFGLVPRGQDPLASPYYKYWLPLAFPTSKIFDDLARVR